MPTFYEKHLNDYNMNKKDTLIHLMLMYPKNFEELYKFLKEEEAKETLKAKPCKLKNKA
jgi:hypothetical protein